jgi:hypothetical protein
VFFSYALVFGEISIDCTRIKFELNQSVEAEQIDQKWMQIDHFAIPNESIAPENHLVFNISALDQL